MMASRADEDPFVVSSSMSIGFFGTGAVGIGDLADVESKNRARPCHTSAAARATIATVDDISNRVRQRGGR
jgi:hypothetical protein